MNADYSTDLPPQSHLSLHSPRVEALYSNGFTGRVVAFKIRTIYLVYLSKQTHITQINIGFYYMLQGDFCFIEHSLAGFSLPGGFPPYGTGLQFAACRIQGYLSAYKYQPICLMAWL